MHNRAQGTIEYLVILGVIVVLSLVVVGLVMTQTGSSDKTAEISNNLKGKIGVGGISIIDSIAGLDANGLLILKNMTSETLIITKIVVDEVDHNFNDVQLPFGAEKGFRLIGIASCEGTKRSYSIKIHYRTANGLNEVADFQTMIINCTAKVEPSDEYVDELIIAPVVITYKVDYNGNGSTGGSIPVDSNNYSLNGTVVVLSNGSLEKTSYSFAGWNTAANGSGTDYAISSTFSIDSNVTLYAKWTVNTYTVTYNGNGNTSGAVLVDSNDYETGNTVTVLDTNSLAKHGYHFNGWNSAANGGGTDYAVSSTFEMESADVTLYAKWVLDSLSTPYVWVTSANISSNNLYKLNDYNGSVISISTVGNSPIGIAVDANGNAWAANINSASVSKVDGSTGTVIGSYSVGNSPRGVAVDRNGNVWVSNSMTSNVSKLRGSDGNLLGTYSLENNPYYIAVGLDGNVWVTIPTTGNVSKLNDSTGAVIGTYPVGTAAGRRPYAVAVDGDGNIWIVNGTANNICKLRGTDGNLLGTYRTTLGSSNVGPQGIAVGLDGNIWVSDNNTNKVYKLNVNTGNVIDSYSVGLYPSGVSIDGNGNVWVANTGNNSITKLNGTTGAVIGTYDVGNQPVSIGDATGFYLRYFLLGQR